MNEYHQEVYSWYALEDDFDWYMDSCRFWDDNHFHVEKSTRNMCLI
jgi:hypothetical protein